MEKRRDARLARDFTVSLPHQLSKEQMQEAVTCFIDKQFVVHGLVCDFAIHAPGMGDRRNYHAHVLVTERAATETGFSAKKDRSMNERSKINEWRAAWEAELNQIFTRDQVHDRSGELYFVDRRSYAERGIEREVGIHLGPAATKLERAGIETEVGNVNRAVKSRNEERHHLREALDELAERILVEERKAKRHRRLFGDQSVPEPVGQNETEPTRKRKSRGWHLGR